MALLTDRYIPLSMFNFDSWYNEPIFNDPFNWLTISKRQQPKSYQVALDVNGYNPKLIKTEITDGNKLIITGKEELKNDENGDYSLKEFRKSFDLPENVEKDKLTSFINRNGKLVVEIPLKNKHQEEQAEKEEGLYPLIVENNENGSKSISMKCGLPKNIDPSKLTVTCKDNDLIIQAEDKSEHSRHQLYYKRVVKLPENTELSGLKCVFDNNKLLIEAPLKEQKIEENSKQIPIEFENN